MYIMYRDSLNAMIAHQFPLNSTELPKGSPLYNDYITALDKVSMFIHMYLYQIQYITKSQLNYMNSVPSSSMHFEVKSLALYCTYYVHVSIHCLYLLQYYSFHCYSC